MVKNIPATLSNSQLYYHNKPCSTQDPLTHKIKHIHSKHFLHFLNWSGFCYKVFHLWPIKVKTIQRWKEIKTKEKSICLFIRPCAPAIVSTRGNFSHQDLSTRLERPQSASGQASWTEEGAGRRRKPISEEEQARRHCQLLNTTITAPPSAVTACHAL